MKASAINPRRPNEMTRAEIAWSKYDWYVNGFDHRRYEGLSLRSGETRCTPDFYGVDRETGQVCLFEIKPSDHPAVYTPVARLRLQTFAIEFAEFRFFICWPVKGSKMRQWSVREVSNKTSRLGRNGANGVDVLPDQSSFLESAR